MEGVKVSNKDLTFSKFRMLMRVEAPHNQGYYVYSGY